MPMPARPGRSPFKNNPRDRRYQEIVARAAAIHESGSAEWGARHELPIPFGEKAAIEHERLLWHEARYQGYGRKVHRTRNDDGTYTLAFQLWTKAAARAFVAARARQTGELPYNPRRRRQTP
jgi:hypothetical protein